MLRRGATRLAGVTMGLPRSAHSSEIAPVSQCRVGIDSTADVFSDGSNRATHAPSAARASSRKATGKLRAGAHTYRGFDTYGRA